MERLLVRIHVWMRRHYLNRVRTVVRLLSQLPGTVPSEVSDELVPRFKAHKEF
jgi:hypothetical protein